MSGYHNNSIFWIETEKIKPNPYQPRREFEPKALEDLADSLRQYGVLQPLVVTRKEMPMSDGHGMSVYYELIAGERRLRASKIAGLQQVPVIIRKETDDKVKLELAIIENLQREDLNPIDRALAFEQLYKQFNLTHADIGKKMGKSRVYVSNSLRLLSLPKEIQQGLMNGRISEGHTRPLLMLSDKPEEQNTLYKEIMLKKMSVRESEKIARKIAQERVRKKEFIVDPRIRDYEKRLSENLGTRVHIEPKEKGGKITIDYFTLGDLDSIMSSLKKADTQNSSRMMESFLEAQDQAESYSDIESSTGLNLNQTENLNSIDSHESLPEFHHDKNEEITEYKKEITAPENNNNPLNQSAETITNDQTDYGVDLNLDLNSYQTDVVDNNFRQEKIEPHTQNEPTSLPNTHVYSDISASHDMHGDEPYYSESENNQNQESSIPDEAYNANTQNYSLGRGGYNDINNQSPENQYNRPQNNKQNQVYRNDSYTGGYYNPNTRDKSTSHKKKRYFW